jgi:site-specific DNA-cytosine methylase
MNSYKNYTYAAFSPLIGGFPIGFEQAVGKPPEYVLNVSAAFWGNDSLYMNWLNETRQLNVPYYNTAVDAASNMRYVDAVVATCPCAGLSQLNAGTTKEAKGADAKANDYMYESARFALTNIKPKVFVGENAPALFTNKGKPVADKLLNIAREFGYSFSLYKTSTHLHGVPQARHRTFYFMWKSATAPEMEWYNLPRQNLKEYLNSIPPGLAHSEDIIAPKLLDDIYYRFVKHKSGLSDIRSLLEKFGTSHFYVYKNGLMEECLTWSEQFGTKRDCDKIKYHIGKYANNKGVWDQSVHVYGEYLNAYIGRTAHSSIHPVEDRSFTLREGLHMMGMPDNFVLPRGMLDHHKITQNVTVCTAQSMAEQCLKFINGELNMTNYTALKQNNEKRTLLDYDSDKVLRLDRIGEVDLDNFLV